MTNKEMLFKTMLYLEEVPNCTSNFGKVKKITCYEISPKSKKLRKMKVKIKKI